MKIFRNIIFILSLAIPVAKAQNVITANDAVAIALKNNFSILVARNDAVIDSLNNTAGNAGMLPSLSVNVSDNLSVNNVNQKLAAGGETSVTGARNNTLSFGPVLNWTLFDGGKMFVTKSKLDQIQALGELQFKEEVLQTVYDVIAAYYNVVKQKQQLSFVNEVIALNRERVKIFETAFGAGLSPKTNLLQAKIDLNVYQENAITQKMVIIESKRSLNQLLSRDADTEFEVIDSIPLTYTLDKKNVLDKISTTNPSVLAFQKQLEIARLSIKEYNAMRLPRLSISAGYNFLNTNKTMDNVSVYRSNGPQFGGSLSIPLFQGGNTLRQIKIAKVQALTAEYNLQNIKNQINTQLLNAFTDFENQQQLLSIEKDNVVLAKENLEIAMQRLRYGQTTSLEVRLAQESYEQSLTRLLNFGYNTKLAETRLIQLLAEL